MADGIGPARRRVADAIKGKPAMAYARVFASDILLLGKSVAAGRHSEVTRDLTKGAQGAIGERVTAKSGEGVEVFQLAGQVAELLALVNVKAATDGTPVEGPELADRKDEAGGGAGAGG
jgi:hypothetical protein